jgi:CPA1 family monovalent cation:H+ antiporter
VLGHRISFDIALFLYRRLGFVRLLAERLAQRLEILLVCRIVLGRLVLFNSQIGKLFGESISITTREIVSRRRQAIENSLDALRRQYPDYLTELEVGFLTQSTLHHEMNRYQSLFEEGLISLELYDDLKHNTLKAGSPFRRPHFDIGLNSHQLVKRLDLLANLDERQLEIVCGSLRPRFVVPNERIIRKGDRGDGVYKFKELAAFASAVADRDLYEIPITFLGAPSRIPMPRVTSSPGQPMKFFGPLTQINTALRTRHLLS